MARFFIEKLFFSFSKVIYKLLKITSKWKLSCFQWFKDTNLKANHNWIVRLYGRYMLFPMVQRY